MIKTVAIFYLIMVVQSSNFFCSFCYALDITSPKMRSLYQKAKTEVKKGRSTKI